MNRLMPPCLCRVDLKNVRQSSAIGSPGAAELHPLIYVCVFLPADLLTTPAREIETMIQIIPYSSYLLIVIALDSRAPRMRAIGTLETKKVSLFQTYVRTLGLANVDVTNNWLLLQ